MSSIMETLMSTANKNRNTFGIIDPLTTDKYPDLVFSFIETRYLDIQDLEYGSIYESKDRCKEYLLLCDTHLIDTIKIKGETKAIVSFQVRYDPPNSKLASGRIYLAIARLFESTRIGRVTNHAHT